MYMYMYYYVVLTFTHTQMYNAQPMEFQPLYYMASSNHGPNSFPAGQLVDRHSS